MSEIPDDIMQSATALFNDIREMQGETSSAKIEAIAGYLCDERQTTETEMVRLNNEKTDRLERALIAEAALASERQHHAEVQEEVRKVLQPFAAEAAVYDPDIGDGDDAVWATPAYFRIKHLRAARALLSRLEER